MIISGGWMSFPNYYNHYIFAAKVNAMKKDTKESIQIWSAIGMLISGVGLSIAGFMVAPMGQIHDSVLWFFAQCLIYAGSIFGIGIYVNGKFNHLVDRLNNNKEGNI